MGFRPRDTAPACVGRYHPGGLCQTNAVSLAYVLSLENGERLPAPAKWKKIAKNRRHYAH